MGGIWSLGVRARPIRFWDDALASPSSASLKGYSSPELTSMWGVVPVPISGVCWTESFGGRSAISLSGCWFLGHT